MKTVKNKIVKLFTNHEREGHYRKALSRIVNTLLHIGAWIGFSALIIILLSHIITIAFLIIRHTTGYSTPLMNQVIERVSRSDWQALKMWADAN